MGDCLPFTSPTGLLAGLLWRMVIVPLLELPISGEATLVMVWNFTCSLFDLLTFLPPELCFLRFLNLGGELRAFTLFFIELLSISDDWFIRWQCIEILDVREQKRAVCDSTALQKEVLPTSSSRGMCALNCKCIRLSNVFNIIVTQKSVILNQQSYK